VKRRGRSSSSAPVRQPCIRHDARTSVLQNEVAQIRQSPGLEDYIKYKLVMGSTACLQAYKHVGLTGARWGSAAGQRTGAVAEDSLSSHSAKQLTSFQRGWCIWYIIRTSCSFQFHQFHGLRAPIISRYVLDPSDRAHSSYIR